MIPVAVAIVNHNTRQELAVCLSSVLANAPAEVVVVDTASVDGSVDMVRERFSDVALIAMENRGYGAAANVAVAATDAPYVLLLNSDVSLQEGVVHALKAYLDEHEQVAIAGPRIVNADGAVDKTAQRFPTPFEVLVEETGLHRLPVPGLYRTAPRQPASVDSVLGAALAIRRTAFERAGGFDERFFMYSEETDLCLRLRAAGWEIHYAPVATVIHLGGASTRNVRAAMMAELTRSRIRLYRLHLTSSHVVQLALVLGAVFAARIARDGLALLFTRDEVGRRRLLTELGAWRAGLGVLWEALRRSRSRASEVGG